MTMRFTVKMMTMKRLLWCALLGVLLSPAAARAQADEVVYYHTDAIGSVRMITDATGTVLARYDFAPFGEKWNPQPNPDRLQLSGKERDTETGLDYFGARYYRPESARFLSVDPKLGIQVALLDLQRWNRYSYVGNRPTRLIDPDGRGWGSTLFKVGKALVKGEDVYSTVSGIAQDTSTIFSMDAGVGTGDRIKATGSLLIELSGIGDVAAGIKGIGSLAMRRAEDAIGVADEIGILRDAARGRGNFGLGAATSADADRLGRAWVGEGYRTASDGKTLLSSDGLRQYRPPAFKPAQGKFQANFEQRPVPTGKFGSNGHLDINDIYR